MDECRNLSVNTFPYICRVCLMYNEVFPIMEVNLENLHLKSVIYKCASIEVNDNDLMPRNICKACIIKTYETYRFIERCKKTNDILETILKKTNLQNNRIQKQYLSSTFSKEISYNKEISSDEEVENYDNVAECSDNDDDEFKIKLSGIDDVLAQDETKNIIEKIQNIKPKIEKLKEITQAQKKKEADRKPLFKKSKGTKRNYIRLAKSGPPFICLVCSCSFDDFPSLKQHRIDERHRRPKKFLCPFCSRPHESNFRLQEHIRTHTGEKPNECKVCSKKFNFISDLKRHMKSHTKEKPHICEYCNKGFSRKQYLSDHLRQHTGEKLICTFCGRKFLSSSVLYHHERTHQNPCKDTLGMLGKDNNYHCNQCDKVLMSEQTLKAHLLLHGPKNFSCEKCGKMFITQERLQSHIKFTHNDLEYPCEQCDKVYKLKSSLNLHIMEAHSGKNFYECEICFKHFSWRGSLRQHLRIHTGDTRFQCNECGHICLNKRQLANHMRTHTGEKPFVCPTCGRAFSQKVHLTGHIRIHTGEKTHICPHCGKSFYDNRRLKKHLLIHELKQEDS